MSAALRHPGEGECTCPRCDDEPRSRGHCTRCRGTGIVSIASLKPQQAPALKSQQGATRTAA